MRLINPNSLKSLYLELWCAGHLIGKATGFLIQDSGDTFLITNYHVLSGINPLTKQIVSQTGGIPDEVRIRHNSQTSFGRQRWSREALVDENGQRWLEHPLFGGRVDVAILRLSDLEGVEVMPYYLMRNAENPREFVLGPTDRVNVIGFPFGADAQGTALWLTATIASEPSIDYKNLPCFLVDCRARPGSSGSPVIVHRKRGDWVSIQGAAGVEEGVAAEEVYQFLGVYSGRINAESDIGFVWKPDAVRAILKQWGSNWMLFGAYADKQREIAVNSAGSYLPLSFTASTPRFFKTAPLHQQGWPSGPSPRQTGWSFLALLDESVSRATAFTGLPWTGST